METIKEQLVKIKALAEKGVGGERDNARRMLMSLMRKHGFTFDDLNCETKVWTWFAVKTAHELRLLVQVVTMTTNPKPETQIHSKSKGRKHAFLLTPVEAADVRAAFGHFRSEWAREQEKMFFAFIQRHRIFTHDHSDREGACTLSREEAEDLLRRMGSFGSKDWHRPSEQLMFGGAPR
jgi:hypothetical protein